jgi:hypothetical protein
VGVGHGLSSEGSSPADGVAKLGPGTRTVPATPLPMPCPSGDADSAADGVTGSGESREVGASDAADAAGVVVVLSGAAAGDCSVADDSGVSAVACAAGGAWLKDDPGWLTPGLFAAWAGGVNE